MPPLASRQLIVGGPEAATTTWHSHDLVHPETGLANDYLNIFNELVMLVEQLPSMPEFMGDVLAWAPIGYVEYFQQSSLPGSQRALEVYRQLNPAFRGEFEASVAEIDKAATKVLAELQGHASKFGEDHPAELELICLTASAQLRALLNKAATIVNHGQQEALESAQRRADRLLAARIKGFRDRPRTGKRRWQPD